MNASAPDPVSLPATVDRLLEKARAQDSRRAAERILHGEQSIVVVALAAEGELPDHVAPGPAVLQVLTGTVTFVAGDQQWVLNQGDVFPIPDARHEVHAGTDAAFALTIATRRVDLTNDAPRPTRP